MGCEQFGRAAQGRSRQTRHRAPIAGAHDDDPGLDCATIKHGHQNAPGASPLLAAQEQMKSMILLTDPFKDWGSDIKQGVGLPDSQYAAAAQLGAILGQKLPGQISGVGHSLGGGLNTVADISGNFPGVNFNPAGVAPMTATRLGIDLNNA